MPTSRTSRPRKNGRRHLASSAQPSDLALRSARRSAATWGGSASSFRSSWRPDAAGCVVTNWLSGAFVVPEWLAPENRRPFSWKRANPVGSLLALRRFRGVFDLACMHFIFMSANSMLQSIWALYTDYRYRWSPSEVGNSLTLMGVMAIVVQGGFVRRIIAWTGERKGLVIGLVISAITLAAYGTATQGWMIYGLVLLGAWGGIAGPSAQEDEPINH